jgi:hypothetical protein
LAIIYGHPDTEKRFLRKLPDKVKTIGDIPQVHQELKQEFDSIEDNGFKNKFNRWRKKRQIKKIEENKGSPLHKGAKGELEVLDKLNQLSNDFHVMCGVNMDLGKYVSYNGKRNLRSAQMDFVVVSRRGVVLIEVKNWSNQYAQKHHRFSPHEQVERAGLVLWIALKSWLRSPRNPRVTSVLLSVQNNLQYSSQYKFVNVKNMENINTFIQSRYEVFSDKEVKRVVSRIYGYITK